jgi:hypothetical protein
MKRLVADRRQMLHEYILPELYGKIISTQRGFLVFRMKA